MVTWWTQIRYRYDAGGMLVELYSRNTGQRLEYGMNTIIG
jgi:hypothetical protein